MDLRETKRRVWTESTFLGQGPVPGSCEHGNKPSCSMEVGNILPDEQLSTFKITTHRVFYNNNNNNNNNNNLSSS
jgi:hypothetical protein